ncbi:MAG TPA: FKBP-type peptidyl-prolyl cis-trans isomerase [Fimbriimonadaceae bacterium]|jgi:FKBP-type peptidyl-prolyl cis-trans isomerase
MKSICYTSLLASSLLLLAGCHSGGTTSGSDSKAGAAATSGSKLAKLETKDDKIGDGGEFENKAPAKKGDTVFMLYTGKLADGSVFDSNTADDDKKAFSFPLGTGSVIKGWDQGIVGMKIGGVRELSIPANLAYGNDTKAGGKIPANSDLYFTVTLLDIVPAGTANQITYDDKKVGTGAEVAKGKKISVHYTITDLKGKELDSNDYSWTIGDGKAFSQIEVGVTGMKVGGVRVLRLPDRQALPLQEKRPKGPMAGMQQSDIQLVKIELKKVS